MTEEILKLHLIPYLKGTYLKLYTTIIPILFIPFVWLGFFSVKEETQFLSSGFEYLYRCQLNLRSSSQPYNSYSTKMPF